MLGFTFALVYLSSLVCLHNSFLHQNKVFQGRRSFIPVAIAFDSQQKAADISVNQQIDLLYDSECPICALEVEFLKKRDFENRIRFTDLSSPDYNSADHGNVKFSDGMKKIRAVLPDNTVITGVEVFRQIYSAIGLGWVFHATNLPIIGKAADAIYDIWAENRLRLTGRNDLADQLKERSDILKEVDPAECATDACELNWDD
mmetsp:Transcript_30064/g.41281  ORF Transcript_30064/g.41281 Transcript_30064/m.41281 type:complete len:202 (+) Transcript_30064:46-651(+)|eukprot:CAMPEP_0170062906 /NCGR_PEP_ID=MMETSP0019_2-20121128/3965_1 /TAXON_ID=98059 /ORGANISM="Dinobryon sp., Strain UTEXLB2267" /LENGTH=201 /DNA_ID=CAMNT_0010269187 /DNA_START=46 /DNA_END=651 /DNA_ORIENTATION=-